MKQAIAFLTILLTTLLPTAKAQFYDFSAISPSGHTLFYKIVGTGVSVIPQDIMDPYYTVPISGMLQIPDSVMYNQTMYPVTSIGSDAFHGCSGLTSVYIPSTVTTIVT